MTLVESIKTCFTKYATFEGRAARSEYWYWALSVTVVSIILQLINDKLSAAFGIGVFLPYLAVTARRLHDIDRSGWWQLIYFIPIIGWIIMLVWCVTRGTPGTNRFGENPLARASNPVSAQST
ncbi:MAG: DUF805 domain-containing protein [Alphaproteobacteria bacterium]